MKPQFNLLGYAGPAVGAPVNEADVNALQAMEMIKVGIIPDDEDDSVGTQLVLAGIRVLITGDATRDEFLDAVQAAGLDRDAFSLVPEKFKFKRIKVLHAAD